VEKKIYFNNTNGDKLCAIVNNPSDDKNKPVIVLAHGFSTSKNSGTYTTLAEKLAKHDISTFRFDFFGHGESEGKFENITISEAVDDILHAIKYLKTQKYIKIGLMGSSFGGISSIIAASKTNDLYLLALKSPVSNYLEKEIETKSEEELEDWKTKGYRIYVSGDGRESKLNYSFFEDFRNNDGYKAAPKIKIPTLIVHGDKDEIVPYKQSVKTCKLIADCKLNTIKGADHRYENPAHKEEMWEAIVNFIVSQSEHAKNNKNQLK
jgi:uncharacterized protein